MTDADGKPDEAPATWENVVVGEATHLLGKVLGDDEAAEEGEEQVEIAHEVREEYRDERDDEKDEKDEHEAGA